MGRVHSEGRATGRAGTEPAPLGRMSAAGNDPPSDFLIALRVFLFSTLICGLVAILVVVMLN